jgi:hypothetical protein
MKKIKESRPTRDLVPCEITAACARGVGQILAALSRYNYLGDRVTVTVDSPRSFRVTGGGRSFRVTVEEEKS